MNLEKFNTKTQSHEDTKIEDELSHQIIGACIEVHRTLGGPGLLRIRFWQMSRLLNNITRFMKHKFHVLKMNRIQLGLLVNFGASHVKDGISRIINGVFFLCVLEP